MLSVHIENIDELAVIECEGRIVRSEAAFKLREAATRLYLIRSTLPRAEPCKTVQLQHSGCRRSLICVLPTSWVPRAWGSARGTAKHIGIR